MDALDSFPDRHKSDSRRDRPLEVAQTRCEIESCAVREDLIYVEHPQRGRMLVCRRHAENIRELDERRWLDVV